MNDVIIHQPDAASLMQVIERAAVNPDIDVAKMERLFELYERIQARNAEQSFHAAMNDCQSELRPIATDANNPQTHSKYASYAALDHAVRPIYSRHGFSLGFGTADGAPADHVRIVCRVAHRDGHKEVEHVDMPADGKGAKGGDVMTKTHATGAAMSYGQRYLLKLIFNLAVGEDRDGNAPDTGEVISEAQATVLVNLIRDVAADKEKFLAFFRIKEIGDLRVSRFGDARAMLEAKGAKK
jgi:hypothetical protein